MESNLEKCNHKIGYAVIEHDGISHPSGEQYCFSCKKTLVQIIQEAFSLGQSDILEREICICAAVKTKEGEIIRGHRHSDCFQAIHTRHLTPAENQHIDGQGFITSKNRYVDRVEGLRLQVEAGIESADPSGKYGSELFSEDLY